MVTDARAAAEKGRSVMDIDAGLTLTLIGVYLVAFFTVIGVNLWRDKVAAESD